jgi:hypothetical protein
MSRTFTIKELNEKIDAMVSGYEDDEKEAKRQGDNILADKYYAMCCALQELKIELNDPSPIVNVTEKIQESLNIIETNKIIKDGL